VVEKSEGAAVAGPLRFVNSPLSPFLFFWACLAVAPASLCFEPLYDRCGCYIIYSGAKARFEIQGCRLEAWYEVPAKHTIRQLWYLITVPHASVWPSFLKLATMFTIRYACFGLTQHSFILSAVKTWAMIAGAFSKGTFPVRSIQACCFHFLSYAVCRVIRGRLEHWLHTGMCQ
jgi:hypothetical protein